MRELLDSVNLASKKTNTLGPDMVAKELQTVHSKKVFGWVYENTILTEPLKHQPQVFFVFYLRGTGKEHIVNIHKTKM